jgi:hypothetical protein
MARSFEQLGAEHDIGVIAALSSADMNHHALAVDIVDLQVCHLSTPQTGSVERDEQSAMEGSARGIDESCDFFLAELIAPNETFWGVDLQLNKTIVELESLEKALKGEGIDRRLVREYRDAMDSIISITDTLRRLRTSGPRKGNRTNALLDGDRHLKSITI